MDESKSSERVTYDDLALARFLISDVLGSSDEDLSTRLIYKYGSLASVFGVTFDDLMRIRGVTPRIASFFSCATSIERQAILRSVSANVMRDVFSALSFIAVYCLGEGDAFDFCMMLDKKMRLIDAARIDSGEKLRQTVRRACESNASSVVVVRYIPPEWDEDVIPSELTLSAVNKLRLVLAEAGIRLYDYVAYTPGKFFSARTERNKGADFGWPDSIAEARKKTAELERKDTAKSGVAQYPSRHGRRPSVSESTVHMLNLKSQRKL